MQTLGSPRPAADEFCERLHSALAFGQAGNHGTSTLPEDCLHMLEDLAETQRFVKGLSEGDLTTELNVKGRLAGSLKALQANLRHLTWQVQQVAAGDLTQKVDFMGDFAAAFNTMIDHLESSQRSERELRWAADAMREAASDLNRALSQEEVLDSMITFAPGLTGGEALDVIMVAGERLRIHRAAGRKRNTQEDLAALEALELDLADFPILAEASRKRQPVVAAAAEGDVLPGYPESGWARAALITPLIIDGQPVGFVCSLNENPGGYSHAEEQRLAVYTNQAAIALSKARLVDRLSWYASTDPLTGVPNRRNFFQRAEQELDRARRYERPVSILMLDIDHFKRINDQFGHPTGDQALSVIAAVCMDNLRTSDVIGRLGGEEFAVLLPETDSTTALAIAERLRSSIEQLRIATEEAHDVRLTVSIGVAEWRGDNSVRMTLAQADRALYRSKRDGRNQVSLFTVEAAE